MEIVRLSSKGQPVLPKNVRERLALKRGLELKVELIGGKIILEPVYRETKTDWCRWRGTFEKRYAILGEAVAETMEPIEPLAYTPEEFEKVPPLSVITALARDPARHIEL
ncbi:MAG: AbrB/MazE/SpoVT family DNA-binding domain-containing protein [Bacillota bacterium]|nr:AbrB/MazE/SpoVT family DNA-binding domain-containing protein [Bacillota bacterium]